MTVRWAKTLTDWRRILLSSQLGIVSVHPDTESLASTSPGIVIRTVPVSPASSRPASVSQWACRSSYRMEIAPRAIPVQVPVRSIGTTVEKSGS